MAVAASTAALVSTATAAVEAGSTPTASTAARSGKGLASAAVATAAATKATELTAATCESGTSATAAVTTGKATESAAAGPAAEALVGWGLGESSWCLAAALESTELATAARCRKALRLPAIAAPEAAALRDKCLPAAALTAVEASEIATTAALGEARSRTAAATGFETTAAELTAAAGETSSMGYRAAPAHVVAPVDVGRPCAAPLVTMPTAIQPVFAGATKHPVIDGTVVPQPADVDWLLPHLIIAVVRRVPPGRVVIIICVAGSVRIIRLSVGVRIVSVGIIGSRPVSRRRGRWCRVRVGAVISAGIRIADGHAEPNGLRIGGHGQSRRRSGQCNCGHDGLRHASHCF